ncbi:hypothetical protein [Bradyrhizobium roseum]|uniref:hypothetical protein n=1 Tax=Bradyrhizobium roseum TaxID=3056648 RepID=UPI0026256260|nr:hypothetical protein [Bradyrhizobium roseus]WKA26364.1 hypothetical protein QUH67_22505 [Bradyrhizobium roseus]
MKEFDLDKLISAIMLLAHIQAGLVFKASGVAEVLAPNPDKPEEPKAVAWWRKLSSQVDLDTREKYKAVSRKLHAALIEQDEEFELSAKAAIERLVPFLEEFGLHLTLAAVKRFRNSVERGEPLSHPVIGEICKRLLDELNHQRFLGLSSEVGALFNTQQFPADVRLRFPSALVEIDEAINCLALERSTASVFHFMRVMEIAVRAAARCLGIPDPVRGMDKNWGSILRAFKAGMEQKWQTAADRMLPDALLFDSLYVSLDAVKNGWRNTTMHVENTYTVAEAQRIRHAVEGLLIIMAARFDENGDPRV